MIIQVRFVSYRTWHSDTHFEYIESSPAHCYHFFNSMKHFYSKVMAVEVAACAYIAKKWTVDGTMKWKVYWTLGLTNYVWRSCYAYKFTYWWDNKITCYNWSDKASNKGWYGTEWIIETPSTSLLNNHVCTYTNNMVFLALSFSLHLQQRYI